ncbi:MAG: Fic family protein [Gammaproteobacteria bacterium]|nr:Fic family protein [Gammaproteobacteria bacterium]
MEITAAFEKADQLKRDIETKYRKSDDSLRLALLVKMRNLWTYHSNAIEGNTLSLGDTTFFLQEGLTVSGKPLRDFLEAKNHADSIKFLYSILEAERPINETFIKQINRILLSKTDEIEGIDTLGRKTLRHISPGEYKKNPNHVVQPDGSIHMYVEPFDVPHQMYDLCQWITNNSISDIHPIAKAALAHYNLVRIHPFEDGNGRTARILMNIILMKEKYFPAVIKIEDREKYSKCLYAADKGDFKPLMLFVCNSLCWTQEAVLEELNKHTPNSSVGESPAPLL